ncbi:hypothetical protein SAMN04487948_12058 [Halogranum amylolyticum]|uniref:Uncharacterized protein n=1 Tax=Halogranum amylolyticum TaxID=660520 RepID=A0A1H8VXB9_9EURY|nr:hypothetical protein [Halogranum amylolyticum]SEP19877.1 hypothetical protein SAMN04487948_12058 [Halogranum amylolyticum]
MVENERRLSAKTIRDGVLEAVGDIFWTIIAIASIWVGSGILVGASPITILGMLWGSFLICSGALLIYLVWWYYR